MCGYTATATALWSYLAPHSHAEDMTVKGAAHLHNPSMTVPRQCVAVLFRRSFGCAMLQSLELKTAVLDPIASWQAEYAHAKVNLSRWPVSTAQQRPLVFLCVTSGGITLLTGHVLPLGCGDDRTGTC